MHTENPQEKVRRNEIWEESERNRSRTYTSFRRFVDSSIAQANFRQCDGMASFLSGTLSIDNVPERFARNPRRAGSTPLRLLLQIAVEERRELRLRQRAHFL